ncbi:MAG: glycosyl transferase [Rhizobiales bacterium]|nr:glycosyl transferase [Hyphomicrobiales bacterium]
MISIIIPSEGVEQPVVATLAPLVSGAAAGLVRDVVLVERTPSEAVAHVADVTGCRFIRHQGSRAAALDAGARVARAPWLMFLHPGAVLDGGWIEESAQFIETVSLGGKPCAAMFCYARSPYAKGGIGQSLHRLFRLIGGASTEQGLLIAREHYERLGGYAGDARHAEAQLLAKIGRAGRIMLRTRIFVPA